MAIGGLGGGLLAGLSGIAQGLQEAQKQREQQQLMQMRQAHLKRINEEDAASSGLFGSILGGLGDVSGGTALTNPMMAGPQAPMPGQGSTAYSPTPQGSGMGSGLSNPLALIAKYESGDRNIEQGVVGPQGGYNPSVGRVTGPSSAGGYFQMIDPTWRDAANKVDPSIVQRWPRAIMAPKEVQTLVAQKLYDEQGMRPWAPYNANLRAALGRGEGGGPAQPQMAAEPQQPPETMLRGGGAPPVAPPGAGGDTGADLAAAGMSPEMLRRYLARPAPGGAVAPPSAGGSERGPGWALGDMGQYTRPGDKGGPITVEGTTYPSTSAWNRAMDAQATATAGWAGGGSGGSTPPASPPPPSGGPGSVSETGIALPGDGQRPAVPQAQQQAPAAMPRLMATAPPPVQAQVQQGAVQTAQAIPQAAWGRMSLPALAQQIEKNNPGASGVVKMMMLEKAQKLMAPMELRQWEMWKLQHNDAIHTADQQFTRDTALLAEDRANRRDERTADRQEAHDERLLEARNPPAGHAQVLTDPTNNQQYLMDPNKPGSATTLTGEPYTPGGAQRLGGSGAGSVINKDAVQFLAESIADYRAPLPPGGRSTPFNQAVEAKVREINPQYDATKYDAKRRGLVAFTSGRQSDSVRSFSVAIDHLDTMAEAAAALENGDVQLLNRVQNRVQTELGYPGAVDFNFAKSIVGAEISKAIVGGVGALTDREELRDSFSAANSPAQLKAVADRAKKLIAGQLGGYRRQAAASGFSEQQFDAALSPQAKKELYGLTGGAPPAQGAQPAEGARPLPPGAENDPDGFGYRIGGKVYVKRGNQIVPHEGAEPTPRQ